MFPGRQNCPRLRTTLLDNEVGPVGVSARMLSYILFLKYFYFYCDLFACLFLVALFIFHRCTPAFSSCKQRKLFFVVVHELLIAVTSLCGAQVLGAWASVVVTRRL